MKTNLLSFVALAPLLLPAFAPAETPAGPIAGTCPNEQALVRYYTAVNEGRLDAANEFLAGDFRCDAALPGMKPGRDGYRNFLASVRAAFPDAKIEPLLFLSQGEVTVCRYRFTGTHRARFLNLRPTHKAAEVTGIDVWTFRDGKVIELHGNFDALGLLVQLGLVPPIKEPDTADGKASPPARSGDTPR